MLSKMLNLFVVCSIMLASQASSMDFNRKCKVDMTKLLSPIVGECQLILLPEGKIDSNGICSRKDKKMLSIALNDWVKVMRKNWMPLSGTLYLKDNDGGLEGFLQSDNLKQVELFEIPYLQNIGTINSFKSEEKLLDNGATLQITGREYVVIKLKGGFGLIFIEGHCEF